jgi:hypothetical protein
MRSSQIHYDNGKDYDLIDVISDYKLNFNRGNIIKYVARAGKKENELKDLRKALDYLQREIEILSKQQQKVIYEFKENC